MEETPLITLETVQSPLRIDAGAVRVGQTRITLDLVVEQYDNGMSPEAIVRAYDVLTLADVYATITYYLQHREQVQTYLRKRTANTDNIRKTIESNQQPITRSQLVARQQQGQTHAAGN